MKKSRLFFVLILSALTISGCADDKQTVSSPDSVPAQKSSAPAAEKTGSASEETVLAENGTQSVWEPLFSDSSTERFIYSNTVLTLNIAPEASVDMLDKVKTLVEGQGGYIANLEGEPYQYEENSAEDMKEDEDSGYYGGYYYDGSYYYPLHWWDARFVIPQENLETVIDGLEDFGEIGARTDSFRDYTLEYRSITGAIAALKEEEQRLIQILEDVRPMQREQSDNNNEDFLENVMRLENSLWSTREELQLLLYGKPSDYTADYYFYDSLPDFTNLSAFEYYDGMTFLNVQVYVRKGE